MVVERKNGHDNSHGLVLNRNKTLAVGRAEEQAMDLSPADTH